MFANLEAMRRELIGIPFAASIGMAQSQDIAPRPKFEVASRNNRGLKIEPAKAPGGVLMIGRLERPSEN